MDQDTYKTSPQLIQGLKDHCDASSWERFYHIYHPLLFRYACSLGLKPTEAEDLIQETVITVSKSIGSFRHQTEGGTFKGWLFTIVKRKFIDLSVIKYANGSLTTSVWTIPKVARTDWRATAWYRANHLIKSFGREIGKASSDKGLATF